MTLTSKDSSCQLDLPGDFIVNNNDSPTHSPDISTKGHTAEAFADIDNPRHLVGPFTRAPNVLATVHTLLASSLRAFPCYSLSSLPYPPPWVHRMTVSFQFSLFLYLPQTYL